MTASDQRRAASRRSVLGPLNLYLLAVIVGIVAGLGAVAFRALIGVVHNLCFLGILSASYQANSHTPRSPFGAWIIAVPVLGALVVAYVVQKFAPEARGHGVPEVMDAIYYHRGEIRPIVAVVKSLASAISIGSGGSVGREGPIVQIGSSFGATIGEFLRLPAWQRITMIAAGSGGGIAATFNTPIGGVLFAVELMMHELSVRTLVPVAIATATAAYIGRLFFGSHPAFVIPSLEAEYVVTMKPLLLLAYAGLGLVMGLVSAAYIKALYWTEDLFEGWKRPGYIGRHMAGMLLIGALMYLLLRTTGHYYVQGVGYATIQDILSGAMTAAPFMLLLFALKLLATSVTLGSGASGGIFSPALYLGATAGGAYGVALHALFPGVAQAPAAYAVAGMAGVAGGTTGAALAAIVMIFEMTRDYSIVIPMTITVALSYGVRRMLSAESIYTEKLARRGRHVPQALQASLPLAVRASDLVDARIAVVPAEEPLGALSGERKGESPPEYYVVLSRGDVTGVVPRSDVDAAIKAARAATVGDVADRHIVTTAHDAPLLLLLTMLRTTGAHWAVVMTGAATKPAAIAGVISRERVADALADAFLYFTGQ